jgi:hypothetical protein
MASQGDYLQACDLHDGGWLIPRQKLRPARIASQFVSTDALGSPHDHHSCPTEFCRLKKVSHIATPINPLGGGRRINIGGEGETAYLGFEDFVTERQTFGGPLDRPRTNSLPDRCASDICLRSAPLTPLGKREICRIGRSGCRITFASNHQAVRGMARFLMSVGTLLEYVLLPDQQCPDEIVWAVLVVEMVDTRHRPTVTRL